MSDGHEAARICRNEKCSDVAARSGLAVLLVGAPRRSGSWTYAMGQPEWSSRVRGGPGRAALHSSRRSGRAARGSARGSVAERRLNPPLCGEAVVCRARGGCPAGRVHAGTVDVAAEVAVQSFPSGKHVHELVLSHAPRPSQPAVVRFPSLSGHGELSPSAVEQAPLACHTGVGVHGFPSAGQSFDVVCRSPRRRSRPTCRVAVVSGRRAVGTTRHA